MDNSDKVSASARDGLIGFGGYTTEQLARLSHGKVVHRAGD